METFDSLFVWFTAATVRGSLIVLMVLGAQAVLRHTISPQWRYALWLPVVLVLLAPHLPQSRWSVENIRTSEIASWLGGSIARSDGPAPLALPALEGGGEEVGYSPVELATLQEDGPRQMAGVTFSWHRWVAIGWATGVVGFFVLFAAAYARTWRRMVQESVEPSREVEEMLSEATVVSGLRTKPRLMLSRAVASPAVTGLIHPTLLLPADFPAELTTDEAQLVLLHELTHLKRRDLPVNWLLCLIQALHWCNPFIWLAVQRMRADREAACDAQVLELKTSDSRAVYGHALLKLEGTLASSGWTLGFVGIFEREAGMRTRICAIARYHRVHPATSLIAVTLLAALTLTGATRAQEETVANGAGATNRETKKAAEMTSEMAETDRIQRKLDKIVIPKLEFKELSVREALAFLEKSSVELDQSEPTQLPRGVKISLNLEPPSDPFPRTDVVSVNPEAARITISLTNIPLGEALRYVTGLSNLKFRVKPPGVEVVDMHAPGPLVLKEWMVPPGAGFKAGDDAQALLVWVGVTFPEGTAASLSPDAKRLTVTNTQQNLDLIDSLIEREDEVEAPYSNIRRKLRTLIIPQLELREATLHEALDFLKKKSVDLDTLEENPASRGVNIVRKSRATGWQVPAIPGLEALPTAPVPDLHQQESRLTLSLSNIPLGEALRYVAGLSNHYVSVEPFTVSLIEKGELTNQLLTKEWKVSEKMIAALGVPFSQDPREDLVTRGISFPAGASAVLLDRGTLRTHLDGTTRRLILRNTQENQDRVDDLFASLAGEPEAKGEQNRAEALIIPTLTFQGATLREAIDFIKARSATLDPEKKGVNVVLDVPPSLQGKQISLSLTNATAWDALRQIARLFELQITAEANAVRLHRPGATGVGQRVIPGSR